MKGFYRICLLTLILVIKYSQQTIQCQVCHSVVKYIQKSTPAWPALPILEQIATQYCVKKHLYDKIVCRQTINKMLPYVLTALWRHHTDYRLVCQNLFLCPYLFVKRNLTQEISDIIKSKPNKTWQKPQNKKKIKIIHITDLHTDLFYTPGAPVQCTQPVCCRPDVKPKPNSTKKAGYWGSTGKCQLPQQTLDLFINEIKKIKPDAIIWTGDNTPHDIWKQSQSYNLNFTIMISQKIRSATNCTVIPVMGNHQSFPSNVYDYNHLQRQSMLHNSLAKAWGLWLDQKAIKMQRQKGYYSMSYPNLNNFKVIAMNTQAANRQNWLIIQDITDPGSVLKWIQNQLAQSQKIGQFVYIVGHIPPKSSLNEWSMRFSAIVDRYSYIIRGQFYGHTHADHLSFFPKMNSTKPWINFKYRVITLLLQVQQPIVTEYPNIEYYKQIMIHYKLLITNNIGTNLQHSENRLDLRKYTKKQDKPQFQLLYRFKQAYGINDMMVQSGITQLRNKLRDNEQIQKIYTYNKCGGICNGSASRNVYCDAMATPQYQSQCLGKQYEQLRIQKLSGPWRQYKH